MHIGYRLLLLGVFISGSVGVANDHASGVMNREEKPTHCAPGTPTYDTPEKLRGKLVADIALYNALLRNLNKDTTSKPATKRLLRDHIQNAEELLRTIKDPDVANRMLGTKTTETEKKLRQLNEFFQNHPAQARAVSWPQLKKGIADNIRNRTYPYSTQALRVNLKKSSIIVPGSIAQALEEIEELQVAGFLDRLRESSDYKKNDGDDRAAGPPRRQTPQAPTIPGTPSIGNAPKPPKEKGLRAKSHAAAEMLRSGTRGEMISRELIKKLRQAETPSQVLPLIDPIEAELQGLNIQDRSTRRALEDLRRAAYESLRK